MPTLRGGPHGPLRMTRAGMMDSASPALVLGASTCGCDLRYIFSPFVMKIDANEIVRYYRQIARLEKPLVPQALRPFTLSNTAMGLGDTVILTDLPRAGEAHGDYITV